MVHLAGLLDLLRRHVVRRAHHVLPARQRLVLGAGAQHLGDAKVGDLHPALLVQQDVLRLDVAVDDALLVGELQRLADLRHDDQRLLGASLPALQQLPQGHAVHELHQQVGIAARLAEVIDGDDVRMVEPGQRPRLAGEALGKLRPPCRSGNRIFSATKRSSFGWRAL